MIRNLLATTALGTAIIVGGVALAGAATVSGSASGGAVIDGQATGSAGTPYVQPQPGQILASMLIGHSIYDSTAEDADKIGDVNDVVMTRDGKVVAAVVGVGGFLGIGEKEVALEINRLKWVQVDDDRRLVAEASRDELKAAPTYDRAEFTKNSSLDKTMKNIDSAFDGMKKDAKQAYNKLTGSDKNLVPVAAAEVGSDKLIGARVFDANNEDIGEVSKILRGEGDRVEAYIVDVGGFLGIGEKPVALDSTAGELLKDADDGDIEVHVPFTQAQLEAHPAFSTEAYDRTPDMVILR